MNEFKNLINKLSKCDKCLNLKNKNQEDCSLINIYKDKSFCLKIPSIWTDWQNRLNANIMIIGQDWGPYVEMQKFYNEYKKSETIENWKHLIEEEKSLTKRNLKKFIYQSAQNNSIQLEENFIDTIYITNAILCARQGNNYRSDSIKLKDCTLNCSEYLKKQIEIVKPKVILTLGYYPLLSLSKIYNFKIEKSLTKTIKSYSLFQIDNITIIPLYHPAAQIKSELQLKQYDKIWKNL